MKGELVRINGKSTETWKGMDTEPGPVLMVIDRHVIRKPSLQLYHCWRNLSYKALVLYRQRGQSLDKNMNAV